MDNLWISVLIACITAGLIAFGILMYLGFTHKADRKNKKEQTQNIIMDKWLLYNIVFSKQPLQVNFNFVDQTEEKKTVTETKQNDNNGEGNEQE